jgi:iron complex outermembrane recepter protein
VIAHSESGAEYAFFGTFSRQIKCAFPIAMSRNANVITEYNFVAPHSDYSNCALQFTAITMNNQVARHVSVSINLHFRLTMHDHFLELPVTPLVAAMMVALAPSLALAQQSADVKINPVVVTGTRLAADPMNLPMAINVIDAEAISEAQLQVNVSESMQRVPGVNAQNRNNYAQDVQLSVRGFGARASFGVRGMKLLTDGIPASQPDGQGQVSHFSLGSADRIEVLRGPFSALYGNASGGVIQIFTEDGAVPASIAASVAAGSNDTLRFGVKANGRSGSGAVGYVAQVDRFETDGPRPHSAATRIGANAKIDVKIGENTKIIVLGNHVDLPEAQDPLGLTQTEFAANPKQVNTGALQFNTRKDVEQTQGGARLIHKLNTDQSVELTLYTGERAVRQFQSIPVATQTPATHPGGVIDFDRNYYGIDARFAQSGSWGNVVAGLSFDKLNEDRRGFQNFVGAGGSQQLGVLGALRREEKNRLQSSDAFVQGEWKFMPNGSLHAGVRASRVKLVSEDRYIVTGNGDDSGRVRYSSTLPSIGASFRVMPSLSLYASAGRGVETPTLNELSYRPPGSTPSTGLNFALRPAKSDSVEIGAKWRGSGVAAELSLFDTKTKDEIVAISNSAGRSSFANAGRTSRRGVEFSSRAQLSSALSWEIAATSLQARYRDSFLTCGAPPCATPAVAVASGNRIPGVPEQSAWTELKWSHPSGVYVAADVKHQGRIVANDTNSEGADSVTLIGARIGYQKQLDRLKIGAFVRGENLSDKSYAGTVIVNEANRRYYEPAARRSWLVGINASMNW